MCIVSAGYRAPGISRRKGLGLVWVNGDKDMFSVVIAMYINEIAKSNRITIFRTVFKPDHKQVYD